jgi:hypothetical protein
LQRAKTSRVSSYSSFFAVVGVVAEVGGEPATVVGGEVEVVDDVDVVGEPGTVGVVMMTTGGECDPSALRLILSGKC